MSLVEGVTKRKKLLEDIHALEQLLKGFCRCGMTELSGSLPKSVPDSDTRSGLGG